MSDSHVGVSSSRGEGLSVDSLFSALDFVIREWDPGARWSLLIWLGRLLGSWQSA